MPTCVMRVSITVPLKQVLFATHVDPAYFQVIFILFEAMMGYAMSKFLIVKLRIETFAAYVMMDFYNVNFIY